MSIAVAVEKEDSYALAVDSQTTFGNLRLPYENLQPLKMIEVGDTWLSFTGWSLYDNILRDYLRRKRIPQFTGESEIFSFFIGLWRELHEVYSFVRDRPEDDVSPFGELDAQFLLVNPRGIFHVSTDMSVNRTSRFHAIGSGMEYSLGALHALYPTDLDARTVAERAAEAAVAFDVHCGGTIITKVVDKAP